MGVRAFLRRLGRSNRLFPRKLKLTREGKYFLLITLGVGFGAINSGNNLLYLTLGLLLSMITLSGILSEIALRNVEVSRVFPEHIHAMNGALVSVTIHNKKRRLASFSIEIEEMFTVDVPCSPCYFLHLKANEKRTSYYTVRFPNRGIFRSDGFRISTRFPFSFFKKSRNIYLEKEFLVYPELVAVQRPRLPGAVRNPGTIDQVRLGHGDEYYGLREYRHGDESSRIHWKATARMRKKMVREFEQDANTRITLVLRNVYDEFSPFALSDLERAVSITASLARKLISGGYVVGLTTVGLAIQPNGGRGQLHRIFRELARLKVHDRVGSSMPTPTGGNRQAILIEPQVSGVRIAVSA